MDKIKKYISLLLALCLQRAGQTLTALALAYPMNFKGK